MALFDRYVGIDYSGAETCDASLRGLQVYLADAAGEARPVNPPPPSRSKWTRREVAAWLVERLSETSATIVGIDHGFSFPKKYFDEHRLPNDWGVFLNDFQDHWPTDEPNMSVEDVRKGVFGQGALRLGNNRWRRITETRSKAKSVFHFDVPGSVAKSTHSGLPWLRYMRNHLGKSVQFWPFDGWGVLPGRSVILEVYPALWSHGFSRQNRNVHQHDAYAAAEWLRQRDLDETLLSFFTPTLTPDEKKVAEIEGWILGIA